MKKEYKKSMIYRMEGGGGEKGSRRSEGGEASALEIIIGEISSVFLSSYPAWLLLEVHLPEAGVEAGDGVEGEHQVEARPDKCLQRRRRK